MSREGILQGKGISETIIEQENKENTNHSWTTWKQLCASWTRYQPRKENEESSGTASLVDEVWQNKEIGSMLQIVS